MANIDPRVQSQPQAMRFQINAGGLEHDGKPTGESFVEIKDNLAVQSIVFPSNAMALQMASLIIQAVGANMAREQAEKQAATALLVPSGLRM